MKAAFFYVLAICLLLIGTLWPLVVRNNEDNRNVTAHAMAALGSLAAVLCAIFIFSESMAVIPLFTWYWFGAVELKLDYLAAWFLLLLGLLGTAASFYAMDYTREYYHRRLGLVSGGFSAFLLSMMAVFTVSNAAAFLVAWEAMTLVSFLLVNTEYEERASRRAAFLYLVMTQIGTALLMAAFLILASHAGSFEFSRIAAVSLPESVSVLVFLLGFGGLAVKAGLIPVHIWLPEAHPAAPSHVSALMSGIMIKSAVYGFCRLVMEFLGPLPLWCGALVIAVAIVTCVMAVLYALMENNVKRLLAYSSMENMGLIFLGLGAGMVFVSQDRSALAGLAFMAALFHVFNHGLFKGLLFLGAGAVIQATHTKNIEKMGGLIKVMPQIATVFAVGCAAIAALPPTNGFASEWLLFQTLFALPVAVSGILGSLAGVLLMAAFGLTGALAAACFVKAFGLIFLAKPRSDAASQAAAPGKFILCPMAGLALLCILAGLAPSLPLKWLSLVMHTNAKFSTAAVQLWPGGMMSLSGIYAGTDFTLLLAVFLLAAGLVLAWALTRIGGPRQTVSAETWTCGIYPDARMEYTSTGFSKPMRVAFGGLLGFRRQKTVEYSGNAYHGTRITYQVAIRHWVDEQIYKPVNEQIITGAKWIRRLQNGSLRLYIGYILAVTVAALIWSGR